MQTLTRETKGLDLVRRDWCTLSREAGSKVLDFILSGKPREEIVSDIQAFLREIASKIKNNALGIEQYVVTKALTKAPGDYPDAKNQPHVQVAKAMMEQGTPIGAGTVVEYVICVDTGKAGVADRCPRESSRRSPPLPLHASPPSPPPFTRAARATATTSTTTTTIYFCLPHSPHSALAHTCALRLPDTGFCSFTVDTERITRKRC